MMNRPLVRVVRAARVAGRPARRLVLRMLEKPAAVPVAAEPELPRDFDAADREMFEAVRTFTMSSPERVWSLSNAVKHIARHRLRGAIVECGVWRGGSMMTVARTLLELGETGYDLYLFDTFEGMSEPTERDVMDTGATAFDLLASFDKESRMWGYVPLGQVQAAVHSVGYPRDRIHFVKGKVEDTIPGQAPERISLLRLDTDWYESTRHELVHLFPRLVSGGVLIIDDYGHWRGARQAVDEYFEESGTPFLLNRIDYTARIGVKF